MSHAANNDSQPDGAAPALCSGGLVSCAPSVATLQANQRVAFAMYLNADPRNAQENRFWKQKLDAATEDLRAAKRTANAASEPTPRTDL